MAGAVFSRGQFDAVIEIEEFSIFLSRTPGIHTRRPVLEGPFYAKTYELCPQGDNMS